MKGYGRKEGFAVGGWGDVLNGTLHVVLHCVPSVIRDSVIGCL